MMGNNVEIDDLDVREFFCEVEKKVNEIYENRMDAKDSKKNRKKEEDLLTLKILVEKYKEKSMSSIYEQYEEHKYDEQGELGPVPAYTIATTKKEKEENIKQAKEKSRKKEIDSDFKTMKNLCKENGIRVLVRLTKRNVGKDGEELLFLDSRAPYTWTGVQESMDLILETLEEKRQQNIRDAKKAKIADTYTQAKQEELEVMAKQTQRDMENKSIAEDLKRKIVDLECKTTLEKDLSFEDQKKLDRLKIEKAVRSEDTIDYNLNLTDKTGARERTIYAEYIREKMDKTKLGSGSFSEFIQYKHGEERDLYRQEVERETPKIKSGKRK